MKKHAPLLLTAAVGGGLAFLLRLMHCRTGFEPDTGLPVPGNIFALLLPAVLAVLTVVIVMLGRKVPTEYSETPLDFPDYFQARGTLSPMLVISAAFLWLLGGAAEVYAGITMGRPLAGDLFLTGEGMFSPQLSLLLGVLTIFSAAALFPVAAACRVGGKRASSYEERPSLSPNLLLMPVAALVLRLVLVYRKDSVNPALSAYYVELLALSLLILSVYRASSFGFHCGRTRRFAVYSALALVFGIATLADGHALASLLVYVGGILLTAGLLIMRLDTMTHVERREN